MKRRSLERPLLSPLRGAAITLKSIRIVTPRARLRLETRDIHARVDAALHVETLDRARYLVLLSRLFGFHVALELRLEALPWSTIGIDFDARRKSPLLRADLLALGEDPASLPHCLGLPPLPTLPAALGALYVAEGSTLGGRIIGRHAEKLGILPKYGASFFAIYGADLGPMWISFCDTLDRVCASEPASSEAARAAVDTFLAVEAWLLKAP